MGSRHQGKAVNTDDLVTGHDTLSLSNRTFIRCHSRFILQVGHEDTRASRGNKHFFTKSCHRKTFQICEQPLQTNKFVLSKSFFGIKNQPNLYELFFYKEYLTRRPIFINEFFLKICFLKMCPVFLGSVHNFDRSDDDII